MSTWETEAGEDLQVRVENGVLWITLNRPDAANALTWPMRDSIPRLMEEASASLDVRAVVLHGSGEKGFCTGADLRAQRPAAAAKPEGAPDKIMGDGARMIRLGWGRLVASILDCEKPVIAGVNGTAAGGGMHLALACDLVVMAEEARLIEVFIRRGIIPDAGGIYMLPRLIGIQKTKELMFFGDDLPAREAERIGLVNKVVPRADLEKALTEWAERLATMPTKAIGVMKGLINRSLDSDRATAFHEEAWGQELVTNTEDSQEGMRSFIERRSPEFKGW